MERRWRESLAKAEVTVRAKKPQICKHWGELEENREGFRTCGRDGQWSFPESGSTAVAEEWPELQKGRINPAGLRCLGNKALLGSGAYCTFIFVSFVRHLDFSLVWAEKWSHSLGMLRLTSRPRLRIMSYFKSKVWGETFWREESTPEVARFLLRLQATITQLHIWKDWDNMQKKEKHTKQIAEEEEEADFQS